MFSYAVSAVITGIDSIMIHVETDISDGLPYFELVGYLSSEVKEAKERVRTAIRNSGFYLDPKRVMINLSPADIKKSGNSYDLAIAASVLCAYGYIPQRELKDTVIIGELGLDGHTKNVKGVLPIVMNSRENGYKRCIVPYGNECEGAACKDIAVYGVRTLAELTQFLNGTIELKPAVYTPFDDRGCDFGYPDFSEIRGQKMLKRSIEVAASGMHNIMMIGPPGSGKSMAARCIPGILPALSHQEMIEISRIYSVAGLLPPDKGLVDRRPFRSPHHTITDVALAGGGVVPHPGEISLAHRGVLFLDELTEFNTKALEILRQPMETGEIMITRAAVSVRFPADFMLVAAINPCKCGYYPDPVRCNCTPLQVKRFIGRISQPILDRIDINVEVKPVGEEILSQEAPEEESSYHIRQRIEKAREIQADRYKEESFLYNSQLNGKNIYKYCSASTSAKKLLDEIYKKYELSARSYHKLLKVARTIADLEASEEILEKHVLEAAFYKSTENNYRRVLKK